MFGFLIALAGGFVSPMLEGPAARPVAKMMGGKIELEDGEIGALAFMIAMIVAGVLCAIFSAGTPLTLAVGGTLGYFGTRIVKWLRGIIEAKPADKEAD